MRLRTAKKIIGLRWEMRSMFSGKPRRGWRHEYYSWRQIADAHDRILRLERRHGFPSKWS